MTNLPSRPTKRKRSPGAKDPDPFIDAIRRIEAGSEALMAILLATSGHGKRPRTGLATIPTPALLHGYHRLVSLAKVTAPRFFPDTLKEINGRGLCPCGASLVRSIVQGGNGWDLCARCGIVVVECECALAPFVPGVPDEQG